MRLSYLLSSILLSSSLLACSFTSPPAATKSKSKGASQANDTKGVTPSELTPSEWVALSKPGPSHRLLDLFVGEWDATITFWSGPRAEPQVSRGRSSVEWILGKRFIKEDFTGELAGEKFQGLGIMGFDNGSRRFSNVWMESTGTALVISHGKYLADTNSFEFSAEVYDPLIGKTKTTRSTITITSHDGYRVEVMDQDAKGESYKSFEAAYTRKGSGKS